jgi:hypothetical protein
LKYYKALRYDILREIKQLLKNWRKKSWQNNNFLLPAQFAKSH